MHDSKLHELTEDDLDEIAIGVLEELKRRVAYYRSFVYQPPKYRRISYVQRANGGWDSETQIDDSE